MELDPIARRVASRRHRCPWEEGQATSGRSRARRRQRSYLSSACWPALAASSCAPTHSGARAASASVASGE
eukprot:scaffold33473_cov119-Isochrysis_galbana.AAC.3